MKPGKARSSWKLCSAKRFLRQSGRCAIGLVFLLAGCQSLRPNVDRNLMADPGRGQGSFGVAERYIVECPDLLDITIVRYPGLSGLHPVGVDGRVDLEPTGRPRVEGKTVEEIAHEIADHVGVPADQVSVRVKEYHGQCVFLFGEVIGLQRAVPYQGQETVVELLRRTGGITAGAAPRECYVIRTHVDDATRPEVYHVDLQAIVTEHDERTNLRLQPFDQVHVGGTRRACLEKCVPPWLRPLYERLCGWLPPSEEARSKS
jgi:protein involved in polysaccharide export with SLBB domain